MVIEVPSSFTVPVKYLVRPVSVRSIGVLSFVALSVSNSAEIVWSVVTSGSSNCG